MTRIGIVAAMPGELHPLVREWPRTDQVYIGHVAGMQCFAACEGIGAAAATRSFSAIRAAAENESDRLDAVLSYGWAGALTCGIQPSRVYAIAEVVDARTGERFPTDSVHRGPEAPLRLVTLDHVAGKQEKRALAERYKAVLVDMEAATVGRLARARNLPFLCLRGVSDGYTAELPDFNRFLTPRGQLRTARFALHALLRPRTWAPLVELQRNSRAAAETLARELPEALGRAKLLS